MRAMLAIQYSNGSVTPGVLLALGDHRVRVAVAGSSDAVEYRLINQRWVSEDLEVVTISVPTTPIARHAGGLPESVVARGFDCPRATRIM